MTDSVAQHAGLPHAVFLHRLAGESPSSALEPRLGRAAFVALRLVDLLGPQYTTLHPDAFHYQHVATARCCRDLPPGATETSHLVGLVHGTHDAFEQHRVGLVLPALFAYAHYLEDEMRLEEALDVLDTLLRVGGEDRKSTRLNSSHSQISYAVFCLKKKNNNTETTYTVFWLTEKKSETKKTQNNPQNK